MTQPSEQDRRGRQIAVLIAAVAIGWVLADALGSALGWSAGVQAFFDLAAGGGFVMALWMVYGLWRASRQDKD